MPEIDLRGKRGVAYFRISTDKQRESSIEAQQRLCREFVAEHGGELSALIERSDVGMTGGNMFRPGIEHVRELVRHGAVDFIVAEELSRISRNAGDLPKFAEICAHHEVRILTVKGDDSFDPNFGLTSGITALMGAELRKQIGAQTKRSANQQFDDDGATGGRAYGYMTIEPESRGGMKITVIDPNEAKVVLRAFQMFADGSTGQDIADQFTREDIPRPRKATKTWKGGTILEWFKNDRFTGWVELNRKTYRRDPDTGVRKAKLANPDELKRQHRERLRIVPQDLWDKVQAQRARRGPGSKGRPVRRLRAHAMSGLLRCGVCEGNMIVNGSSERQYYVCGERARSKLNCTHRASVRTHIVDQRARDLLLGSLHRSSASEYLDEQIQKRAEVAATKARSGTAALERQRAKLASEIEGLTQAVAEAGTPDTRRGFIEAIEGKRKSLGEVERDLQRATEASDYQAPSPAQLRAAVARVSDLLTADAATANRVMRALLGGGPLTVSTAEDGSIWAEGSLFPLLALSASQIRNAGSPEGEPTSFLSGCGGRI